MFSSEKKNGSSAVEERIKFRDEEKQQRQQNIQVMVKQ